MFTNRGRSWLHKVMLLVMLASALAACAAPAATPATGGQTGPATHTDGRPLPDDIAADQTIRYVTRGFSRLDPASEGGFGRPFISHLWMPFFIRDDQGAISPWLATGYDVNEDGTVYTIHINPNAVWSDGSPVIAQEAKDYWAYGVDPERCVGCYLSIFTGFSNIEGVQAVIDGTSEEISGVVAVDDKTLQITLIGPDPTFIAGLALFDTGFVKMEDVDKGPTFALDGSARVNGPFMVESWDVDNKKYEIVQNPNWWGEKKPFITRITAQESADENISFIQWQNDEVDIAHWLSNIREGVRAETPDVFYLIPYATNFFFTLWSSIEPVGDENLRRALMHAVDWDAAIAAAWEGARNNRVMKTILTPELQCYKADNWPDYGYDPELAKQELAASQYGSGENVPLIRITPGGQSPNYIRTAEIIMEQWKNVLGITNVDFRPGARDVFGQDQDLVQVRRQSQGAILPDPVNLLNAHYRTMTQSAGYTDEELGTMLQELSLMSRDDPAFCGKVQEAEARLLGHYPILPMIWDLYEYAVKPWIKNFGTNVDNNWATLLDMYVAEH